MKPTVYLMFGAQGSGKSTQGQILAENLNLPFFDTGYELRQVAKSRSPVAKTVDQAMKAGKLVSRTILEGVLDQFLASHSVENGLVMDGFTRTLEEVRMVEKLSRHNQWQIVGVFIEISHASIEKRIKLRAKIENRSDDQPAIIAERLAVFEQETLPVVKYLKQHHQLVEIDGEPSPEDVTKEMLEKLKIIHD